MSSALPDLEDDWYAGDDSGVAYEDTATAYDTAADEATTCGSTYGAHRRNSHAQKQTSNGGELEVDLFYDSSVLPPFLATPNANTTTCSSTHTYTSPSTANNTNTPTASREQDIRLPVKDPMSKLAQMARDGSDALRQFRREEAARRANLEATDTKTSTVNTILRQHALSKGAEMSEDEYDRVMRQARVERLRNATAEERAAIEAEEREAEAKAMRDAGSMRAIDGIGGPSHTSHAILSSSSLAATTAATASTTARATAEEEKASYYKRLRDSLAASRRRLPVYKCREALMDYIAANQVCVIEGETGSGKTTQLVQYLLEEGYAARGIIGCTQPRKVAAVGVAKRVADEVGCELGATVGYAIRLDNRSSAATKIKFMTEGVLLREVIHDADVSKYSVIVLDEAHERSIDTDVLLGVLKDVVRRRSDLKVIVTSATMNTQKFSDFFCGAKVFKIPGKVFPVDVVYEPPLAIGKADYIEDVVCKIVELHLDRHSLLAGVGEKRPRGSDSESTVAAAAAAALPKPSSSEEEGPESGGGEDAAPTSSVPISSAPLPSQSQSEDAFNAMIAAFLGDEADGDNAAVEESPGLDILVFLPGKEEILSVIAMVKAKLADRPKRFLDTLLLIPLYSELPPAQQLRALEPTPRGVRKCVVSTNVAETSLTIDGVRFVVDAGFMKTNVYRPAIGMNSLQTYPISQAEANQRKGRAGRTARGVCYRLYSEEQFEKEMLASPVPEIQRSSIDSVVLLLKSIGVDNLLHFDFLDVPPEATIRNSLYKLWLLGALGPSGAVTAEGRAMLEFPVEPALAKMLLVSARPQYRCPEEMLSIAAMLSAETRSLYVNPQGREDVSRQERSKFNIANSDHLTLLNIFMQFLRNGKSKTWCRDNYLDHRTLMRAVDIRAQFTDKMRVAASLTARQRGGGGGGGGGAHSQPHHHAPRYPACRSIEDVSERLRQVLVYGHISQVAKRIKWNEYESIQSGVSCFVSPTSAIVEAGGAAMPAYCVYHEFRQTTKEYMCLVTEVCPRWIVAAARGVVRPRGVAYSAEAVAEAEAEETVAVAGREESGSADAKEREKRGDGQWGRRKTTEEAGTRSASSLSSSYSAPIISLSSSAPSLASPSSFSMGGGGGSSSAHSESHSLAQSLREAAAQPFAGLGGASLFAAPPLLPLGTAAISPFDSLPPPSGTPIDTTSNTARSSVGSAGTSLYSAALPPSSSSGASLASSASVAVLPPPPAARAAAPNPNPKLSPLEIQRQKAAAQKAKMASQKKIL